MNLQEQIRKLTLELHAYSNCEYACPEIVKWQESMLKSLYQLQTLEFLKTIPDKNVIKMVELKDFEFKVKGKYLVCTITKPFLNIENTQYLEAVVSMESKKLAIDVTNQTVTHISKEPLERL